jgi:prepilin-type N-terminal cleavage/methylation domain-containing protein
MCAPSRSSAFTLIELLVVMAIIALLLAILLPALSRARDQSKTVRCLANVRGLAIAAFIYTEENNGHMIQAGLAHTGATAAPEVAWVNTLQAYYGNKLLARCPSDYSPYWFPEHGGAGTPVPGISPPAFRRTSYGINNFLDTDLCPYPLGGYPKLSAVPRPGATVLFLEMAQFGGFAAADHPHVENWGPNPPVLAASQLQTDVHGGRAKSNNARSNFGFLGGHAETARFGNVYDSLQHNAFDPAVAR